MLTRRRRTAAVLLAIGLTAVAPGGLTHAAPRPSTVTVIGLHKGSSGDNVRALQDALNHAGIGVKYGVDGYFGSATQASVRAFQRFRHLPITGVVDAATATALGFATPKAPTKQAAAPPSAAKAAPAPASGVVGLRLGSQGPAVAQVQQAIIAMGWPLARGADGVFGVSTQRALMAIQRANGLIVTGAMNIATARLLGLTQTPTNTTVAPATTPAPAPAPAQPAPAPSPKAATAVAAALSQLGVPYQPYALSPGVAFDCSGLTAWAWAQAGVSLPHQSAMQFASLPHVAAADARPGDLLFYHSPVSHVTMYLGNGMQVQAPRPNSVIQVGPVPWSKVVGVGRPG
jgi:cell wall-associated NlpC family hydrolase